MTLIEVLLVCFILALLAPVFGASTSLAVFIGVGIPLCLMLFSMILARYTDRGVV